MVSFAAFRRAGNAKKQSRYSMTGTSGTPMSFSRGVKPDPINDETPKEKIRQVFGLTVSTLSQHAATKEFDI